ACALQTCLTRNTYTPDKCDEDLRRLYACCSEMYRREDGNVESTPCPMQSVVERWLQRNPGGQDGKK
ncbi:hypothetical protein BU15DRAFT_48192, partial [Melanogaster broomeanus]